MKWALIPCTVIQYMKKIWINPRSFLQQHKHKWKISETELCSYCHKIDSIRHFFLLCEHIQTFWYSFLAWWNHFNCLKISRNFENLEECILFGFQSRGEVFDVLNYCLLHVKYYIYKQKLSDKKIDFYEFLMEFK